MSKDPEAQYFGVLLVSGSHPCVVLQPGQTIDRLILEASESVGSLRPEQIASAGRRNEEAAAGEDRSFVTGDGDEK